MFANQGDSYLFKEIFCDYLILSGYKFERFATSVYIMYIVNPINRFIFTHFLCDFFLIANILLYEELVK